MAGDWFQVGDDVVIDPGGPNQETATISAFGSLIFPHGMRKAHTIGEVIADLGPHERGPAAAHNPTTAGHKPTAAAHNPPTAAATPNVATTGVQTANLLNIAAWLLLIGGCALAIEKRSRRKDAPKA